jgi:protease I
MNFVKPVLLIIPPERFRDEELFITKEELEKGGFKTAVASTKLGRCAGSRGGYAVSEFEIDKINAGDFESVIFIGGGGSKLLFRNETALRIAREIHARGKVIGAICLAPVILANAGVLKNKKATVAGTESATIKEMGAAYTGPGVTVDGNVVTANAPKSSKLFGQTICNLLKNRRDSLSFQRE